MASEGKCPEIIGQTKAAWRLFYTSRRFIDIKYTIEYLIYSLLLWHFDVPGKRIMRGWRFKIGAN